MGLSKEEQRSKQRESRPDDFHPTDKQRNSRPAKRWKTKGSITGAKRRVKIKIKPKKKIVIAVSKDTRIKLKKERVEKINKPKVKKVKKTKDKKEALRKVMVVANVYREELIKDATNSELFLKGILEERCVPFKFQEVVVYGNNSKFYILDFLIRNVVVELDGNHHLKGKQLDWDLARDKHLRSIGYKVIRIRNSDLYQDWKDVERRLKNARIF